QTFGFNVQPQIAREFGVRTDVPWRDLHGWEKEIVLNGPEEKKHIAVTSKKGVHELDFTFRNARLTVTEELKRPEDEWLLAHESRFLGDLVSPACHGTRDSPAAAGTRVGGIGLAEATAKALEERVAWAAEVPAALPEEMRTLSAGLVDPLVRM